ncbi:MAG: apolipoprotein N-acyltransferase [Acidobacteria bacterium]|nr:apolipoprotein N-acyltransferase [Acidobacteriota bacterium]
MDYSLALLSGTLLALSFPRFGHPAFAWIAVVPLLLAVSGRLHAGRPTSALRAFTLGLAAGLVYFVGTLYWTGAVLRTFGGLAAPLAALAMLLLALYLALFPALTALIMSRLARGAGTRALLLAPAVWVATEYLRGYLFGGFPWVPLGNSQVTVLPVAQLASVLGVYGLSALVAYVNGSLAYALVARGRARGAAAAAAFVTLTAVGGWGAWRIADGALTREGTPIRIGLLQGNIAQEDKWNPREARRIFTTYIAMTRDAVGRGAEFVIWPESSTPFMFEEEPAGAAALRALAREVQVPILFGSDQVDRSGDVLRLYNAAFLLTPQGETGAVYRKIHLVPFGEYIPFKEWLYFASPLVERLAEFAPGTSTVMLPVGPHLVNTAICYEVVYPSLIRDAVLAGSQLLTTITNDAWYGYSSAPYQHFELASMRAIEQGRYLARAANTGISGIVDPYGRVVQRSAIFEQAGLVGEARVLTGRTMYARIGDLAAYLAIAVTMVALVTIRERRRVWQSKSMI